MNEKEARILLHAYRHDLREASDPDVLEAIGLLDTDPDLQRWVDEEQAFDRAFAATLKGISPPPGLRDRILSGAPEDSGERAVAGTFNSGKVAWWRQPVTWSAAACFLLLVGIGFLLSDRYNQSNTQDPVILADFGQFVDAMVGEGNRFDGVLDYKDSDVAKIKAFLASSDAPFPAEMRGQMKSLDGIGCKSFAWEGRRVGMICLRGDKTYHLYTTESASTAPQQQPPLPLYRQIGNHAAAAWRDENLLHVLTVEGSEDDLRTLF
jgi:hypothetical protein